MIFANTSLSLFMAALWVLEHKPSWPPEPRDQGVHSPDDSHKSRGSRQVPGSFQGDSRDLELGRERRGR